MCSGQQPPKIKMTVQAAEGYILFFDFLESIIQQRQQLLGWPFFRKDHILTDAMDIEMNHQSNFF